VTDRFAKSLEENVCEHGDHAAPMFARFCSPECEVCDATSFDLVEVCCAGICGQKGVASRLSTVGALRKALEGLPDDMPVRVRWDDDECCHVGNAIAFGAEWGCTETLAFMIDAPESEDE
jgi:hypothetical protein